jgi:hypothetical protein
VDDVVVYDACVLYPAPLRSFLMHLAVTDLYHARRLFTATSTEVMPGSKPYQRN